MGIEKKYVRRKTAGFVAAVVFGVSFGGGADRF